MENNTEKTQQSSAGILNIKTPGINSTQGKYIQTGGIHTNQVKGTHGKICKQDIQNWETMQKCCFWLKNNINSQQKKTTRFINLSVLRSRMTGCW